jgi:hypothetical protein
MTDPECCANPIHFDSKDEFRRRVKMGQMGRYCKAYPIAKLRQFQDWKLYTENLRKERKQVDGKEVEVTRELPDDGYLYLQENYIVTDGIFLDQNVVFDNVTDEWVSFCNARLQFQPPA